MGWNGSGGGSTPIKPKVTAKKPSPVRGVVAGLVVVAAVCVAYFAFFSGNEKVPEKVEKKPTKIKEVKPAAAPTNRVAEVKKPSKPKTFAERYREKWGDKPKTPARIAAVSCCKQCIDMTPVEVTNGTSRAETRLVRYSNPLHQELVKYVHPGQACDVPDPITDKEALALCDGKMEYGFDEPIEVLEEKQAVEGLAKEMKKYIEDGGHAKDFLMQLMERQDHEYALMQATRKQITELCKSGDADLAQAAFDKYNEYLRGKGLPSVKMTPLMEHYLKKNGGQK